MRDPRRTDKIYVEGLDRLRTKLETCFSIRLMAEVAHTGQNHRHPMLIRSLDDFCIAN